MILTRKDGTHAGLPILQRTPYSLQGIDLAFMSQYKRRGLATAALRHLQQGASVLTLHVLKGNSAERLYRNLGFQVTHETDLHRHMTWQAGPQ